MQQTSSKWVKEEGQRGGKGDPRGIVEEIEILPYYQEVHIQIRIRAQE